MCFGGGSSAKAPITTPANSTDDAYKDVTVSATPASPSGSTQQRDYTAPYAAPKTNNSSSGLSDLQGM